MDHTMPRRRSASGKRSRAGLRETILALANAMEGPLHRARGFVDALVFVGYGLESISDDGARPVLAIRDDADGRSGFDQECLAGDVRRGGGQAVKVKEGYLLLVGRGRDSDRA
jgi:hypothetical protein